ncbi:MULTISPECIES: hypothetical protein [unclassified Streptomyces]|uniref:hypothetical protein n=1 Tax=unclassified Streptomyces TaxID=2593676 RepID=UPI00278C6E0C|nr:MULTISPECIES: hypothetical protein [unclassified Streptomyces]
MGRHSRLTRAPHVPTVQSRRRLAAGLLSASAVVAAGLVTTVDPAAPPAPDRSVPQHSGPEHSVPERSVEARFVTHSS